MDATMRINTVVGLIFNADGLDGKDTRRFGVGGRVVDMCTYALDALTADAFERRLLFERGEAAIELMALTVIDRLDLVEGEYPVLEEIERKMRDRAFRSASPAWAHGLRMRYSRMVGVLSGILALPADDARLLIGVPKVLDFITGGKANFSGGPGLPEEVFPELQGRVDDEWTLQMVDFAMWCVILLARFLCGQYGGQSVTLFGKHIPVERFAVQAGNNAM